MAWRVTVMVWWVWRGIVLSPTSVCAKEASVGGVFMMITSEQPPRSMTSRNVSALLSLTATDVKRSSNFCEKKEKKKLPIAAIT